MPDNRNAESGQQNAARNAAPSSSSTPAIPASHTDQPESGEFREKPDAEEEERSKWGHNPDTWMVILTTLLMFIGVGTVWIFYGQFREMKTQTGILNDQAKQAADDSIEASKRADKQLELIGKQAGAAQGQVEAIRHQMRQDQRAWISEATETALIPGVPAVGQPFLIRTTFKNIGKSAAVHVKTRLNSEFLPKESVPTFQCPGGKYKSKFVATGTLFPSSATFGDLVISPNLQQPDREKIMSNAWNIWVYGRVEYLDVFDTQHWSNFCYHLLSGGGYAVCDKHTETDEN